MSPIISLWKDTWFAWLLMVITLGTAAYSITALFLAGFPAMLFYFLYFAFIRYDDKGKKKST